MCNPAFDRHTRYCNSYSDFTILSKLALQGTPVAGWVLLDPELNLGERQTSKIKRDVESLYKYFSGRRWSK